MATFEVPVLKIDDVIDHPNADRLSICIIGGYQTISGKLEDGSHRHKPGDLIVYVPEGAIVPEWLLKQGYWDEAKNRGMLAGPQYNRVKAIKLRGTLSQGIMFPVFQRGDHFVITNSYDHFTEVSLGDNVADVLDIVKWEPTIPASMSGDMVNLGIENTVNYDIENLKNMTTFIKVGAEYGRTVPLNEKGEPVYDNADCLELAVMYPNKTDPTKAYCRFNVLKDFNFCEALDGEEVVITEKCHGTLCMVGYVPEETEGLFDGHYFVASKGLGAKGLVFKDTEDNRKGNLYVRTALELDLFKKIGCNMYNPTFLLGEIFGKGVQDLHYGFQKPVFRAFDYAIGPRSKIQYMSAEVKYRFFESLEIEHVPVLYKGIYSKEIVNELTRGMTMYGGHNIREGIVITPLREKTARGLSRVILKSVSEDYLLRKGEVTEFA